MSFVRHNLRYMGGKPLPTATSIVQGYLVAAYNVAQPQSATIGWSVIGANSNMNRDAANQAPGSVEIWMDDPTDGQYKQVAIDERAKGTRVIVLPAVPTNVYLIMQGDWGVESAPLDVVHISNATGVYFSTAMPLSLADLNTTFPFTANMPTSNPLVPTAPPASSSASQQPPPATVDASVSASSNTPLILGAIGLAVVLGPKLLGR